MKKLVWVVAALLLLLGVAYVGAGYYVYDKLSTVSVYSGEELSNTPDNFVITYDYAVGFDTTPYRIDHFERVSFPSREPGIMLSGWYAEVDPNAPAVVLTHGIDAGKYSGNVLTPAGMLYKNGFNVLLYDLRNHGESDSDGGRTSVGNKEYLDVLGAWDYLVKARGFKPDRVGLYGLSLGAGSTLNAFAEEPGVSAVLVDSPFADLQQIISEEMTRKNYPTFLAPAGILSARLVGGVDLLEHSPKDAIRAAGDRPIFIIHGTDDERINVHHARDLEALAKETGADLTVWYVDGAHHVESVFLVPEQYEQAMTNFYRAALITGE